MTEPLQVLHEEGESREGQGARQVNGVESTEGMSLGKFGGVSLHLRRQFHKPETLVILLPVGLGGAIAPGV